MNDFVALALSRYVSVDPTTEVDLPKKEPEAQNLKEPEVEQIYGVVALSSLPERNVALVSVLLHRLRAEEVSSLNVEDYEGRRLRIQKAKAGSKGWVPLNPAGAGGSRMQNLRHPDYQERKEWVGRGFDPEAFDLKEVNEQLRDSE